MGDGMRAGGHVRGLPGYGAGIPPAMPWFYAVAAFGGMPEDRQALFQKTED
jgi:hypothetical protein